MCMVKWLITEWDNSVNWIGYLLKVSCRFYCYLDYTLLVYLMCSCVWFAYTFLISLFIYFVHIPVVVDLVSVTCIHLFVSWNFKAMLREPRAQLRRSQWRWKKSRLAVKVMDHHTVFMIQVHWRSLQGWIRHQRKPTHRWNKSRPL